MVTSEPHLPEESSAQRRRLAEAEAVLRAIQHGEIDAFVVEGSGGKQVYTLHSAEEPYRTLVEEMHEGAVVLTARGDIAYANAAFAALIGQPLESVVGCRFDQFVSASDRLDVETLIARGGGRCRSRLIGPGSQGVEVSLSLSTTKPPSGDRLNLIVTDLGELLEAHHRRDRAERVSRSK